jgi:REP element-mobilizing transposase RayT
VTGGVRKEQSQLETKYHRRSIRLTEFDYSQPGAYFVTLATYQRAELFGRTVDGGMQSNRQGEIVKEEWFASANIRKEIRLYPEEFVVMPNHIHGIVWIEDVPNVGATGQSPLQMKQQTHPHGPAPKSLASFIVGFKSSITKRIRNEFGGVGVWQRNYYEHIIRNEKEWDVIRRYIESNPQNWETDEENPKT